MRNFYPQQYELDSKFVINHNYLSQQFSDCDTILELIKEVVIANDFTLGSAVDELESLIAIEAGTRHAIGVGSGTDALFLSLKSLGVGPGDEVITTPYTFYATIGAIVTSGAKPVFCDVGLDFNIDASQIDRYITKRTKAIIPVHWAGTPCDMDLILDIANNSNISVIEDACHAIQAVYHGKRCGSFGTAAAFSFHPLKNLNVWGDGGIVTTNDDKLAERLRLIRNHGLVDRDTCVEFAYNSRLDTIQAVIAKHTLLNKLPKITSSRIRNSLLLDEYLSDIPSISTPPRDPNKTCVFHLYQFTTSLQSDLYNYLKSVGIDCKVHYPVPMHLQPAASYLGYQVGDFPVAERLALSCISLPVHEFISQSNVEFISKAIHNFLGQP